MKILSIGNSFSDDAQRYLHKAAKAQWIDIESVNLYIGGCSFERHYNNMHSDSKSYEIQFNGQGTGFMSSIKEALLSRSWDIITIQQVSHDAPYFDRYTPYIEVLAEYVRKYAPKAKLILHQTWAYEANSKRLTEELGYSTPEDMLNDVVAANKKAAKLIGADGIIPSGEMMLELSKKIGKVHRDTFHATFGAGRYALALLWIKCLCGAEVAENQFADFDEAVSEKEKAAVKEIVNSFEKVMI